MNITIRRVVASLMVTFLVSCQTSSVKPLDAKQYIETDCSGPGTLATNTHLSCRIQATYRHVDGQSKVLTLAPRERSTVSVSGCSKLEGTRFVDQGCR